MSSNYLQFSEVVPRLTEPEEAWLRRELETIYVFGDAEYDEDLVPDHLDPVDSDWRGCRCYRDLEDFDPDEGNEGAGFAYEFHDDDTPDGWKRHLWVYADEGADLDRLTHLVKRFLHACRPRDWWSLTYSVSCSKPCAGEFGGGGVFVTAQEIKWFDVYDLVAKERLAFERHQVGLLQVDPGETK